MSTKIVKDEDVERICTSTEHNPPMHIVIPPGHKLIHKCPSCGKTITIRGTMIHF